LSYNFWLQFCINFAVTDDFIVDRIVDNLGLLSMKYVTFGIFGQSWQSSAPVEFIDKKTMKGHPHQKQIPGGIFVFVVISCSLYVDNCAVHGT